MTEFIWLQVWRCSECGHEFYTTLEKKQSLLRRISLRKERIKCPVCKKVKAYKARTVRREKQCEKI